MVATNKEYPASKVAIGRISFELRDFLSPESANNMAWHEFQHMVADEERRGKLGFTVTAGWVVAYYMVIGPRTPKQWMDIASAPGFGEMSGQDWKIYNKWKSEYYKELQEEKFSDEKDTVFNGSENSDAKDNQGFYENSLEDEDIESERIDNTFRLIEYIANELDRYKKQGQFTDDEEIFEINFEELIHGYGDKIYETYNNAILRIKNEIFDSLLKKSAEPDSEKVDRLDNKGNETTIFPPPHSMG